MEFKGTKGEWVVDRHPEIDSSKRAVYRISTEETPTKEQLKANAQLIAAAPEMLKALQLILSNSNDHAMIRVASKAINKALGK